ncbi:MAG: membrane dipeptidase [Thermoprotei archaeon]
MRFVDLHEDLAYSSQSEDVVGGLKQSSVRMLREVGDDVVVFGSLYPHINTVDERSEMLSRNYGHPTKSTSPLIQVLLEQIKFYLYLERAGLVKIVRGRGDLDSHGVKILLALEGADVLTDPYDLYLLRELNVLCVGLTWNYDNKFASSCMSKKDYGLTGYGEEVVKLANELGIIIDVAHAGKKSVLDAAALSSKPIIASHANAKSLRNHVRNLDDEELEALAKTGGVVGVTAINTTLSDQPSIGDLAKHAAYIGEKFGWDHVALGTDFLGIENTPSGFEDVRKIGALGELLGDHAQKVFWDNAMRVLKNIIR